MGRRGAPPSDDDDVEITVCNPRRGGSGATHTSSDGAHDRRRSSSGGNGGGSQRPAKAMEEEFRPFRRWAPFMTPLFVVTNILLFAVAMYVNDCPKRSSSCIAPFLGRFAFQPLLENPLFGPSSPTLLKMGALEVSKTTGHRQGWRLVTCIWLHAGLVHLLANMLSLIFIGIRLEQEFGFWRIGPLYVISGIGGSLMSGLFIESTISVGASGALFGLLGAMLSELIANWTIYANKFAAMLTLVIIIAINLAVGLLPHVDNFAHLGGFMTGFLLGFVLLIRPQFGYVIQKSAPLGYHTGSAKKPKYKVYQYVLWGISTIGLIVWFTVGLVLLFQGYNGNKHCSWCHYLSCVPLSSWSCKPKQTSCMTLQTGYHWNLTCSNTRKTQSYFLINATDEQILQLCTDLCT